MGYKLNSKNLAVARPRRFPRDTTSASSTCSTIPFLVAERIAFGKLEKIIEEKQLMNEQQELPNV